MSSSKSSHPEGPGVRIGSDSDLGICLDRAHSLPELQSLACAAEARQSSTVATRVIFREQPMLDNI